MSCTSVLLPLPVPPIMPTVEPDGIVRSTSESAYFSAVCEYLKDTFSKRMLPSATVSHGEAGSSMPGFSMSTSYILFADSALMVSMT